MISIFKKIWHYPIVTLNVIFVNSMIRGPPRHQRAWNAPSNAPDARIRRTRRNREWKSDLESTRMTTTSFIYLEGWDYKRGWKSEREKLFLRSSHVNRIQRRAAALSYFASSFILPCFNFSCVCCLLMDK